MARKPDPNEDWKKKLKDAAREVRDLLKLTENLLKRLKAIDRALMEARIRLGEIQPQLSPRQEQREGRLEAMLRRQAARGARSLDIRVEGSSSLVRLEGEAWFGLPPLLTELLVAISDDSERAKDGFPRWRSRREIADRIGRLHGEVRTQDINGYVYRLREKLLENDANPFWVETAAEGVRFRHRRRRLENHDADPRPPARPPDSTPEVAV